MVKIAIIVVYYGEFPPYFDLWLKSCEYNPTIDFFVVTDNKSDIFPENVHKIGLSFDEFRTLTEKKLCMPIALERPYKICDFRPMYGLIFEEYVKNYDYWGHCDVDLVFGDIRKYLDKYNINDFVRFGYLGHLSLYRNDETGNNLFKFSGSKCGSWQEVVSNERNFLFDEWNGIYSICIQNNIPTFDQRIFADISVIYKRFRLALEDINFDQQVFYWENGHVYRTYWEEDIENKDEFIYIHFKKRKFDKENFNAEEINSFYIGPAGFTEKKGKVTLDVINKINPFPGKEYEEIELRNYYQNKKKRKWNQRLNKIRNFILEKK